MTMANIIVNYDGSITTTPQQLGFSTRMWPKFRRSCGTLPRTHESPVRAKGSYHSLTPCVSSDGTIVDMLGMAQVVQIDKVNSLFTAQAGCKSSTRRKRCASGACSS